MDKWEAQYNFWSSFGLPAYDENAVPDRREVTYPYITYEAITGGFDEPCQVSASIWDRGPSYEAVDRKADEIRRRIKSMGCPEIEGGRYRVYVESPEYATHMGDPDDDQIRRNRLMVTFEYMTEV